MRHNASKIKKRRRLLKRNVVNRRNKNDKSLVQKIDEIIKDKKVAIIGNAQAFYEYEWQEELEQYDVIVRINAGICLTEEQKERTTDRCDIYFDRCSASYATKLDEVNTCETPKLIVVNGSRKRVQLDYMTLPQAFINRCQREVAGIPTMGYRVFRLLQKIGTFSELALFGFDFFNTPDFYDGKTHILKDRNITHKPEKEKLLIFEQIKQDERLKFYEIPN